MTDVLVNDHETPEISDDTYLSMCTDLLYAMYGHLVCECGYCGKPRVRSYVCDCGYQQQYNDDKQLVWSNK